MSHDGVFKVSGYREGDICDLIKKLHRYFGILKRIINLPIAETPRPPKLDGALYQHSSMDSNCFT